VIAILIFMVALLFFVVALEVDARRRPQVEKLDNEEDDLMLELTQTGSRGDRRCACDPLDERALRRNVEGG
jgi:hypothetical protein